MSTGMPGVVAASGNANSTTYSVISGGSIVIRNGAGQLALTGQTAAGTIASLNRDAADTLNALKPILDKEKIEAGFEIASEASKQMGPFLTNRANAADALKNAMDAEIDPALKKDLKELSMALFYSVDGIKFSKSYYERSWSEGRPAPFLQAKDVLNSNPKVVPDPRGAPGYFKYEGGGLEMIYNPTAGQAGHIQPIKTT